MSSRYRRRRYGSYRSRYSRPWSRTERGRGEKSETDESYAEEFKFAGEENSFQKQIIERLDKIISLLQELKENRS